MSDPAPAGGGAPERFSAAVSHVRDTAKWTLAAYAAIGAILVAGSQLSEIGSFDWRDPRLWVAVTAVAASLTAIAAAVHFVVSVQTAGEVSLADLADQESAQEQAGGGSVHPFVLRNQALLAGYDNVRTLQDDYLGYIKDRYEVSRADDRVADAQIYGRWVSYLGKVVAQLLAAARYDEVSRAFSQNLRRRILGPALAAGFAVGVFAWAANPREEEGRAAPVAGFRTPVEAVVALDSTDRERLGAALGSACDTSAIRVLVLTFESATVEVVSVPENGCQVARFPIERTAVQPAVQEGAEQVR